jgi:hypothetical protein
MKNQIGSAEMFRIPVEPIGYIKNQKGLIWIPEEPVGSTKYETGSPLFFWFL